MPLVLNCSIVLDEHITFYMLPMYSHLVLPQPPINYNLKIKTNHSSQLKQDQETGN